MASKNTLSGGGFQDALGNVVANGYMLFVLSQDAQVNGNTQIAAGHTVKINLDANGNIVTGQTIWANDVLSPAGTFYNVSVYSAVGQLVWGPNAQQVLTSPSPFNVGAWVPAAINIGLGIGGTLLLETNGTPNGQQSILNLASSTNISLVDNGTGSVTIGTFPTTSTVGNVPSFVNTTGKLQDSGVDANDIVLRSSNNQFGNTIQTFGLSGSGEVQVSNTGITIINSSLATIATLDTTTGTGAFSNLRVNQTPAASATASDHSIPVNCNGTIYYMRLSTTP